MWWGVLWTRVMSVVLVLPACHGIRIATGILKVVPLLWRVIVLVARLPFIQVVENVGAAASLVLPINFFSSALPFVLMILFWFPGWRGGPILVPSKLLNFNCFYCGCGVPHDSRYSSIFRNDSHPFLREFLVLGQVIRSVGMTGPNLLGRYHYAPL